ncbi:zinc-dependent metalloprotease [Butyricimonas synergistica]|uniref:zinc-dependent metalloprotease n=1 Tax=Butyricimonas synergistica TaxID=544644 RepID=UPI001F09B67A|nr:zinc-dependent metalloprotease [Butyricimonas synergistica]
MRQTFGFIITCFVVLALAEPLNAGTRKKKKVEEKKVTPYEKLFQGKKVETVCGMVTLHKVDGKVYFEFPMKLMGRDMLLGSTVSEISDNGNALVGQKVKQPLHIKFTLRDSTVEMREVTNRARRQIYTDYTEEGVLNALAQGVGCPVMEGYKVMAYNADSSAVVFDMTDFLVSDNKRLDPFDPNGKKAMYGACARRAAFKKDLSYVDQLKSFEDNMSITSSLSYVQDLLYMGIVVVAYQEPVTIKVNRSFVLLPEKPVMHARVADPRIGYFTSSQEKLTKDADEVKTITFANKWDVRPKDVEAYKRGELVEPVKQIVFYVDNKFPEAWKQPIREAVLEWNKAFEKIGFKNVMAAKDFPTDDPEFDPANLKYNCIYYAPIGIANAMGPSWVDPRNAEIIQASVFVYHDVIQLVNDMRFVQTSQVDPRVRTMKMPEDVLEESMRYIVAHEVGHCLGLMHNMASSASIPTEKYRDKEFMAKYGTTPSIMDYARYNYIAQPEDEGIALTPPRLGVYDFYAIDWGYRFFPDAKTSEDEVPYLNKIIADKMGDPMYRYGKQQLYYGIFDPTSLTEDLSDDAVKAGEYGIKNLKYIMNHLNEWLDGQDTDYTYRYNIYKAIASQYARYIYNAKINIGGFYINEHMVGDPYSTSAVVPREIQKRSAKFVFEQLKDMDWLDNIEVVKNLPLDGSMARLILKNQAASLLNTKRLSLAVYRDKNAYSPEEYLTDLYESVWSSAIKGTNPTESERILQTEILKNVIKGADPLTPRSEMDEVLAAEMDHSMHSLTTCSCCASLPMPKYEQWNMFNWLGNTPAVSGNYPKDMLNYFNTLGWNKELNERAGFDYIFYVFNTSTNNNHHLYYQLLTKVKDVMEKRKNSGSYETRAHYAYLLSIVNDFMKSK